MPKPKSYEGIKAHFTPKELDDMEKRAREWSRMDQTDKIKLINMARYALAVEAKLESAKLKWHSVPSHHDCGACDAMSEAFIH